MQHGACVFTAGRKGPGSPVEYRASCERILRILRYPRYIYTAKTLYGDTGELIIEELLERGHMTMSSAVKTVADRLTHNMEGQCLHISFTTGLRRVKVCVCLLSNGLLLSARPFDLTVLSQCLLSDFLEGRSMEYNEVVSTFSKLVETHFLQRCPPVTETGVAATSTPTPATPGTPAATAAPAPVTTTPESFPDCYKIPHVTLIGQGKRRRSSEDGEDQRNGKKAKMVTEVGALAIKRKEKNKSHLVLLLLSFRRAVVCVCFL